MKALNNFLGASAYATAAEALAIGHEFGLDPRVMLDVINTSTGRSFNTEVVLKDDVITGRYGTGFALGLLAKDVGIAADLAEAVGVDAPACQLVRRRWEAGCRGPGLRRRPLRGAQALVDRSTCRPATRARRLRTETRGLEPGQRAEMHPRMRATRVYPSAFIYDHDRLDPHVARPTTGDAMLSFVQATDGLEQLIDPAQDFRPLGSGFLFTEGPAWNAAGNYLIFSDIPGDARWRWSESGGMERVAWPTFKGNGMVYEHDGSLLVCEQVTQLA